MNSQNAVRIGVGIENPDLPQCRLLHLLLPQLSSPSRMLEGCRCCHQVVGGLVGPWGRRLADQTALGKMILIFPYFLVSLYCYPFNLYPKSNDV